MRKKRVLNLWESKDLNLMLYYNISKKEVLKLIWKQNKYQLIKVQLQVYQHQVKMMIKVMIKISMLIKIKVIVIKVIKIKILVAKDKKAHINKKKKIKNQKNKIIDSLICL